MIGRGALGKPWVFREINHFLNEGQYRAPLANTEICQLMISHIQTLHDFYGEYMGVRFARKHVKWYLSMNFANHAASRQFNLLSTAQQQIHFLSNIFD